MKGAALSEIARRLGVVCTRDSAISGYQVDSRHILPGELFFALAGESCDGHQFLRDVALRGGIGAVVAESYSGPEHGLELLLVPDVLAALHQLAHKSLSDASPPLLGITGSVGKTTAKEFAATLLASKYRIFKNPASYNAQRTFPLNLLNRTGQEELLILEMGMSEPKELERLVQIAAPDVAVITKIALSHAMNFPEGLSAIARAKAEIASDPRTKTLILDLEDLQRYPEVFANIKAEKATFSTQDATADTYLSFAEGRFRVDEKGVRAYQFDLPFKQQHLLHNFLAAATAARKMGMQWEEIERAIPLLQLPKMRFEQFERGGVFFINDAYNANPTSMRAALENLPEPKEGGKRIGVLGTMKELGPFSQAGHEEIGYLAQKKIDVLLCLGGEEATPLCEAFSASKKPLERFEEHRSIAEKLKEIMLPGDVVLLKGSRSMKLEKVLELLDDPAAR